MKAIRVHECGGPEVLKLEEVAAPKPSAGEVPVRMMLTSNFLLPFLSEF
jgi:NADPH:quinone reductase-like Zn-dependent oxidoreductase